MNADSTGRTLRSAIFHALRAGFRALPIGEAARDALRQRFFERFPTIRPVAPQGQAVPSLERRARIHAGGRAIGYVERTDEPLPDPMPATLVAFYLPQFHTIPENDEWWGKGFTEWRNVARALPQFEGHAQPRLPGELGFYDLRNPQVLRDQAALAQAYGIGAFCMYHYWFGGRTLLELPHQQWLNDTSITLPICLCWANENWTRTWDGRAADMLIAQQHSPEDDVAYIAHVAQYLRDPRYLRVDGKPLVLVYRPGKLPNPRATADRWRAWCRENGIGELCIGYVQSFERPDPRDIGFDVAVEFPPNLSTPANITDRQPLLNPGYRGEVLDWRDVANEYSQRPLPEYRLFPGVNCGWDNEPRRPGGGRTHLHASPHGYGRWLRETIRLRASDVPHDRLVFINAWNEWAEGAALEPDARLGHALLRETRGALSEERNARSGLPCVVVHAWHLEPFEEILTSLQASGINCRMIVTTAPERLSEIRSALQSHRFEAELHVFENRGRDIAPFLRILHRLASEHRDLLVLKLHTKVSAHLDNGTQWRHELISSLLDDGQVQVALKAFQDNPTLGLIAPAGHTLNIKDYLGSNVASIRRICNLSGLREPSSYDRFISGSMFWVRVSALKALSELSIDEWAFEEEAGQIDGTAAHGFERVIALAVADAGYFIQEIGEPRRVTEADGKYPYARGNR